MHLRGGDKSKFTRHNLKGCDEPSAFARAMSALMQGDALAAHHGGARAARRFFVASDQPKWVDAVAQKFAPGVVVSARHLPSGAAVPRGVDPVAFDLWGLAHTGLIIGSARRAPTLAPRRARSRRARSRGREAQAPDPPAAPFRPPPPLPTLSARARVFSGEQHVRHARGRARRRDAALLRERLRGGRRG